MKIYKILTRLFYSVSLLIIALACSDDEGPAPLTADFLSIGSSYYEANGTGNVTIPFRGNASFSSADIIVRGSATEGSDFTIVGVSAEGIQINIIDDNELEPLETIRLQVNSNGNSVHTVTIVSDCEDKGGLLVSSFSGDYDALEDYGGGSTFGPYSVTLVQDATNPNKFTFTNFYGSGATWVGYMVFDVATGTVKFPDQTIKGIDLTNSSGTFSLCPDRASMSLDLNFDGGDWVYHFTKH